MPVAASDDLVRIWSMSSPMASILVERTVNFSAWLFQARIICGKKLLASR